jgi:CRISPR-associated protein Cas5h
MKILVFDIFAPYGHFKIPYTITSPLTFPVPSKTSVYGILGAIMGLDKKSYLTHFQNNDCLIGISVKNPVKKTHIAENLLHTKNVELFARIHVNRITHPEPRLK